jgi:hypothetical protein
MLVLDGLSDDPAARDKPKDNGDYRQREQHVNEAGRDVEREETEHPKHEEHHCECP